ncbi:pilus assembly protein [Ampullimonas aquatilis]|uniref:pilus assembly protein n=1 Tax=Ampullimonas aquatilis TaxID=1341549 RepID=UPI003C76D518
MSSFPNVQLGKQRLTVLFVLSLFMVWIMSAINIASAQTIPRLPPHIGKKQASPMIMLNMSRDHQLSYKAYNEYSDLDGDGSPETSYANSIDYYGYFDSKKCYLYDAGAQQFNPSALTTNHYCNNAWSGNFLNWVSMTRMDVIRKILYGGYRSTDSNTDTVLERAYLPTDAHSFAKYYSGNDLSTLMPVAANVTEISICNTTMGSSNGSNRASHTNTNPPLMKVAIGNYALWNSNERWQCYWSEEKGASNGNNPAVSGINASASNPSKALNAVVIGGVQGDFVVRVKVCDPALLGGEDAKCKQYPNGNRKPTGLLHKYGENDEAEFGLLTGSYQKNISGGVLRKNVESFANEVNTTSDGRFTAVQGIVYNLDRLRIYGYDYSDGTYIGLDGNCTYQLTSLTEGTCGSWGNPIGEMYLEVLRYFAGKSANAAFDYGSGSTKDATLGLTRPTWVDPFGRAAAIQNKYGEKQCRPINVINFNASVTSYDHDQWGGYSDLNSAGAVNTLADNVANNEGIAGKPVFIGDNGITYDGFCTAKAISAFSSLRGICPDGPTYRGSYIMTGAAWSAHTTPIRTDLTLSTDTSDPNFKVKTYGVSLATAKPKVDIPIPALPGKYVSIQPAYRLDLPDGTHGGGTLVDFRIVSQNKAVGTGKFLVQWEDSEQGGDYDQDVWGYIEYAIVGTTLNVTTYTAGAATSNPQGFGYILSGTAGGVGDGPHFHSGIIGFNYNDPAPPLAVTPVTHINASGGCINCQVQQPPTTASYNIEGTGSSTLKDPLWYSAKYGGFTDSNADNRPNTNYSTVDFSNSTYDYKNDAIYAAANKEWDAKDGNGNASADGIPDSYFYAINPAQLEKSLETVFISAITKSSNAAALSSSRIGVGSSVIDTGFNPDGSGLIYARPFVVSISGNITTVAIDETESGALWKGHVQIKNQNYDTGRTIISNDGNNVGVKFRWSDLNVAQKLALNTLNGATDSLGAKRLDWLRGNHAEESGVSTSNAGFRRRTSTNPDLVDWVLGDVANSTGWLMTPPAATYFDSEAPGYSTFSSTYKNRTNVAFVGANDGMLHALSLVTGNELFAYVPNQLYSRLSSLTDKGYQLANFVDGSPLTGDMYASSAWHTMLFEPLGRGGQGIFALDVTDPSTYSESNASTMFKWEFTDADDVDLGYITGRPASYTATSLSKQIGKFNDGKYYVMFGNGYFSDKSDSHSGTGRAALFILGAEKSGSTWVLDTNYKKLTVGAKGDGPSNGLSTPIGIDIDNNSTIDYIYAADLKGNIWKFDVSSSSPSSWTEALSGEPLYTAKDSATTTGQPVSSAVVATPHKLGGWMINFATGKSITSTDYPTSQIQTVYGIWDKAGSKDGSGNLIVQPGSPLAAGRSRLLAQTTISDNNISREFSVNAIGNWTNYDGWYYDLPVTGEVVLDNPDTPGGGVVSFLSIHPQGGATSCGNRNLSVLMDFDIFSGAAQQIAYKFEGAAGGMTTGRVSSQYSGQSETVSIRIVNLDGSGNPQAAITPTSNSTKCGSAKRVSGSSSSAHGSAISTSCPTIGRQYWREIINNSK